MCNGRRWPELKVLFITGYADNAVLSHENLKPGMQILIKPFAMELLAIRIKKCSAPRTRISAF